MVGNGTSALQNVNFITTGDTFQNAYQTARSVRVEGTQMGSVLRAASDGQWCQNRYRSCSEGSTEAQAKFLAAIRSQTAYFAEWEQANDDQSHMHAENSKNSHKLDTFCSKECWWVMGRQNATATVCARPAGATNTCPGWWRSQPRRTSQQLDVPLG